jgi:type I restriction enzyme M protein
LFVLPGTAGDSIRTKTSLKKNRASFCPTSAILRLNRTITSLKKIRLSKGISALLSPCTTKIPQDKFSLKQKSLKFSLHVAPYPRKNFTKKNRASFCPTSALCALTHENFCFLFERKILEKSCKSITIPCKNRGRSFDLRRFFLCFVMKRKETFDIQKYFEQISGGLKMAEENSRDLIAVLWAGADILRSKMDANEYKDYLLGIVFYKYLSDKFLYKAYDLAENKKPRSLKDALQKVREMTNSADAEAFRKAVKADLCYFIEPDFTYTHFVDLARNNSFQREDLKKAFNNIEQSDPLFTDLFTDIDLYSSRLGTSDQKKSDTVASLILEIDRANFADTGEDVLGNAYEYLIGQFASETGKKAGEFYTPQAVSKILTRIAVSGQENKKPLSVYDPCMGSGSLLLNVRKFVADKYFVAYYGQELMTSTFNLARMNMFLHGIAPENQHLRNADTLDADWPTGEENGFDMVLMNPPYSANWSASPGFSSDERFMSFPLAPKSKADYAFLLHGFYHLKNTGTMAIVLPHGVLFRGAAEGTIREKLLRDGRIYAVIGLPANLFYNTSIPTCIIVLKKHREGRDVLFIDASRKFEKGKKQNSMTDEHIDSIIELYKKRQTVEKETYLASFEDIERNDFNLNIPRYVDNFEKEEEIDLGALITDMQKTDREMTKVQGEFLSLVKELTSKDAETKAAMKRFIKKMEG